jgi:transcriptional regulator with XRE-family HTH domain
MIRQTIAALRAERRRQGKRPEDIAAALGVSVDMIRRYERNASAITLEAAELYAQALGYTLGELLPSSHKVVDVELVAVIAYLQMFTPAERRELTDRIARDLAWLAHFTQRSEPMRPDPKRNASEYRTEVRG